jgi:alkylation response protein AidB-like acyl-CoA dehydrogenase
VASALRTVVDRARAMLACEAVGTADASLSLAVAYAKVRQQFGRPIGSFQAIKHMCADMLMDVETSRSVAYYAAWAAATDAPDLSQAAAQAKVIASEALFRTASQSIQIHGGIGFTWETDVHLHFKRAKSTETLLGEPAALREAFARSIDL